MGETKPREPQVPYLQELDVCRCNTVPKSLEHLVLWWERYMVAGGNKIEIGSSSDTR